jgi:hypothetical protein
MPVLFLKDVEVRFPQPKCQSSNFRQMTDAPFREDPPGKRIKKFNRPWIKRPKGITISLKQWQLAHIHISLPGT